MAQLHGRVTEISEKFKELLSQVEAVEELVRRLCTDNAEAFKLQADLICSKVQSSQDFSHDLYAELRGRMMQNHADAWSADEKRAQSLAEVVLISLSPQIERMKDDLMALVGEKAVEVFRGDSQRD